MPVPERTFLSGPETPIGTRGLPPASGPPGWCERPMRRSGASRRPRGQRAGPWRTGRAFPATSTGPPFAYRQRRPRPLRAIARRRPGANAPKCGPRPRHPPHGARRTMMRRSERSAMRSFPTTAPRRTRRNIGPARWPAASSQTCTRRTVGEPMNCTAPSPFWSVFEYWTHPGKVEAPYTICIASASNLTGLVKSSVECRRTGL